MAQLENFCKSLLVVLNGTAFLANSVMLIYITKKRDKSNGQYSLHCCLLLSNVLSTLYMLISAAVSKWHSFYNQSEITFNLIAVAFPCIVICSNSGFNLAIAYSRMCCVTQPDMYSNPVAIQMFSKKPALTVVMFTLGFASISTVTTAITMKQAIVNWAIKGVLILTSIALCVFYVKLVWEYHRAYDTLLAGSVAGSNSQVDKNRKQRGRYLTRLFIGITTSFIIFNAPLMAILPVPPPIPDTSSSLTDAKLAIFAATYYVIGLLFDPLWLLIALQWKIRNKRTQVAGEMEHASC